MRGRDIGPGGRRREVNWLQICQEIRAMRRYMTIGKAILNGSAGGDESDENDESGEIEDGEVGWNW